MIFLLLTLCGANASAQAAQPLNRAEPASRPASTVEAAAGLREAMLRIQAKYHRSDGTVDYRKLETSPEWQSYRRAAASLRFANPADLKSRNERLSFWINLYNALVADAVITFRIDKSVNDRRDFFTRASYDVGGTALNLEEIEHGILRGNRPAATGSAVPFRDGDSRGHLAITPVDPRIHFALNCGARSCPLPQVYDAEKIDRQLDGATRSFINGPDVRIDVGRRRASLSRIFEWYADDFGKSKADQLRFVAPFLRDTQTRDFVTANADRISVTYLPYDWTLNVAR